MKEYIDQPLGRQRNYIFPVSHDIIIAIALVTDAQHIYVQGK